MRHGLVVTLGLFTLLGAGAARAAGADKPNTLSAAEKKAGWKLLFDGKTTKGWRGYQKQDVPDGWKVVDGVLTRVDKGGDLVTAEEFGDFEFQTDWRISEGGNSGIIYRAAESEKAPYLTGPEYQLLDDERHPDGKAGKDGDRTSGSLYDMVPPSKKVAKPAGEWNTAKIVARGKHVEHWLNGEKVVDIEIGSDDWKRRLAESKWAKVPTYATTTKGHIDLQDHGAKVEFRSMKVRVLK